MIFLKLFLVFSYIGLFNFGGGYAMLSFIQQEVVVKHHWLAQDEFTDIVAISQMTPGPIGINCATYVGYTAVQNDPWVQSLGGSDATVDTVDSTAVTEPAASMETSAVHNKSVSLPYLPHLLGILGSLLASLSILWLPFIVMIMVTKLILKHQHSIVTKSIFQVLRPAIIGLLASAALTLMTTSNFGDPRSNLPQFLISLAIFAVVFVGIKRYKWNIIYTTLCCGAIGALCYGVLGL